jgi:hypothetical protein
LENGNFIRAQEVLSPEASLTGDFNEEGFVMVIFYPMNLPLSFICASVYSRFSTEQLSMFSTEII